MEIEEKNYTQNKIISYNIVGQNKNQEDVNVQKFLKKDAYNEFLNKINKSLRNQKDNRLSDTVTIRTSYDKTKQYSEQNNNLLNNNEINSTINSSGNNNIAINLQNQQNCDNNDKRKNIAYINNLYNKEIENKNNSTNFNNTFDNNNSNYDNKVINNNIRFGGSENIQNNNNSIEYENNNIYYHPFNKNNNLNNRKNNLKNDLDNYNINNDDNNSIQIPDIILTVIHDNNNNKKKQSGKNWGFFNLCKKKKKNKNGQENINNNNNKNINDNNEVSSLNQNLRSVPYDNDNSNEELIEYGPDNQNINENPNNEPFIESQSIYHNHNKEKPKIYHLRAEPIENNNKINNHNEGNNMGNSSQKVDIDRGSEYSSENNIERLIREKTKLSPFLLAIILGSLGLLFLLYKSTKIREFLLNILKGLLIIPQFLKELLLSLFGKGIYDFLEKYSDSYRFLGFIIILFSIWFVFRLLMKFVVKLIKGRKEENNSNNNY